MVPVGQPAGPPEPGLIHPQHGHRFRLDELDRAAGHDRALHSRPRHPVRRGDLGLVSAILDRQRQRRAKPGRGTHPGRHLRDLLSERRARTCLGAASPTPLAPLHHRELAATWQIARPGQHPVLARRRHRRAGRAPSRVRIIGDQLDDLDPNPGEHDTLHRQPGQAQQTRRIIATVNHGPRLSSRCSKTQRGSRSRGPPSFRRAARAQPQVARSRSESRRTGFPSRW
jgi:hypothetical protein